MTHTTAIGTDDVDGPQPGCWCCGDRTVQASLLRLEGRPEVGVCFRCVDQLTTANEPCNGRLDMRRRGRGGGDSSSVPASTPADHRHGDHLR